MKHTGHEAEKQEALGVIPLPLEPEQTRQVTTLLREGEAGTDGIKAIVQAQVNGDSVTFENISMGKAHCVYNEKEKRIKEIAVAIAGP